MGTAVPREPAWYRGPRWVLLEVVNPRSLLPLLSLLLALVACGPGAFELDRYVFEWGGGVPADLETEVAAAGGKVFRVHPEVELAVVTGISEARAAELAATLQAQDWGRDLAISLVPGLDAVPRRRRMLSPHESQLAAVPAAQSQGGDPTDSTFYDRQWNLQITDTSLALEAGFRGSPDVRVAVLDTGIDPYHVDLIGLIDEVASIGLTPSFAGPPVTKSLRGTE